MVRAWVLGSRLAQPAVVARREHAHQDVPYDGSKATRLQAHCLWHKGAQTASRRVMSTASVASDQKEFIFIDESGDPGPAGDPT